MEIKRFKSISYNNPILNCKGYFTFSSTILIVHISINTFYCRSMRLVANKLTKEVAKHYQNIPTSNIVNSNPMSSIVGERIINPSQQSLQENPVIPSGKQHPTVVENICEQKSCEEKGCPLQPCDTIIEKKIWVI